MNRVLSHDFDREATFLNMDGEKVAWPKFTMENQNVLVFDTSMSEDSITDGSETWTPIMDFWLAIANLAQFEDAGMTSYILFCRFMSSTN